MRIAVNTRFLLKDRMEGTGWYTYEVCRRMVEKHPEDEFIFLFDRPWDDHFIFASNVKPVRVFPPARHPLLWYFWFEWAVPLALKQQKAEVFLSPDNYLSLRSSVPTVLVTHDIAHQHFPAEVPALARRFYHYFMPRYHQHAARIVAVSEYTKQDIIDSYNIPAEKISVGYNGIKPEFVPIPAGEQTLVRQQYAEGKDYFFYVGAIHPRKNIHRLIAAFDQFKAQTGAEVKLLLAGRFAWQTGPVRAAYEAAKHKADIVFLGYVNDEELPRLLASALALTYVSIFEGFGVPLLEAMYCDVPVITANVTSMPEVVGRAGLCVDPQATEAIAGAMQQIYENANLRSDLITAGRQQRQQFSWDRTADLIYDQLHAIHPGNR